MKIAIYGILFAAAIVFNLGTATAGGSSDGGDGLFIGLSCESKKKVGCPTDHAVQLNLNQMRQRGHQLYHLG